MDLEGRIMKSIGMLGLLLSTGLWASACIERQDSPNPTTPVVVEKPFGPGGHVEMQLDGGNYELRPAADTHIRVTLGWNVRQAKVEITIDGTAGHVVVRDTPHNNFQAIVEVPSRTDLVVHLKAGNLSLAGITGNKNVE